MQTVGRKVGNRKTFKYVIKEVHGLCLDMMGDPMWSYMYMYKHLPKQILVTVFMIINKFNNMIW